MKPKKENKLETRPFDIEKESVIGKSLLLQRISWSPFHGIKGKLTQYLVVSNPLYIAYVVSVVLLTLSLSLYSQQLIFSQTLPGLAGLIYSCAAYIILRAVANRVTHRPMSERSAKTIIMANPSIMVVDPQLDDDDVPSDISEK